MTREQTVGDPVIRKGNGHEHHHRHDCVHKVRQTQLKPLVVWDVHVEARLEQGQPIWGDEAVVDLAVGTPEAVGEVEEEAGESAEAQKHVDHQGGDRGAIPVAVDRRQDHLESEERARREEVHEHRGLRKGFLDTLCDGSPFPARSRRQRGLLGKTLFGVWVCCGGSSRRGRPGWGCAVDFDSNTFGTLIHNLLLAKDMQREITNTYNIRMVFECSYTEELSII